MTSIQENGEGYYLFIVSLNIEKCSIVPSSSSRFSYSTSKADCFRAARSSRFDGGTTVAGSSLGIGRPF